VSDISSGDVSSAREASEPQAPTSVAAGDMSNSPVREAVIALRADVNLLAEEIAKLAKRRTLSAGVTFQATLCNALRDRIREKPLEAAIGLVGSKTLSLATSKAFFSEDTLAVLERRCSATAWPEISPGNS
jgi:hypothetical protein